MLSRVIAAGTCRGHHLSRVPSGIYSLVGGCTQSKSYSSPARIPSSSRFGLAAPIEGLLLRSKLIKDPDTARFIGKVSAMTIYSMGTVTALGTLGVDTKPIIAGIGVTGFTVGFALKEIAGNFLAGIFLVFQRPFQKGQYLRILSPVGGATLMEGEVESIDSRYVLLKSREKGGTLMIPSAMVYSNPFQVFAKAPEPSANSK